MPIDVSCPNCHATLRVADQYAGKQGKCPKCATSIKIGSPTSPALNRSRQPPPTPAPLTPPPVQSVPKVTPISEGVVSASEEHRGFWRRHKHWVIPVGAALGGLILGFFAGREHVKYQLRTAINEAGEVFRKNMQDTFGGKPSSTAKNTPKDATPKSVVTTNNKSSPSVDSDLIEIGHFYSTPGFQVGVVDARIGTSQVKDMMGDTRTGKDSDLIITLRVRNTHDRKILRYSPANDFIGRHFELNDDVDNLIRPVGYGLGSKPIGALTGAEDILPGQEAMHLELFSIPPPKTKYLVLTMDLAAFGGEGKVRFRIPSEKIKR